LPALSDWFKNFLTRDGAKCRVITVIGSGGKTSLIWHLAAALAQGRKILVSPTAKMLVPQADVKLYDRYYGNCQIPSPAPGVTLAGNFNEATCKLESFPLDELENIIKGYDFVLIEGDGSRGLPYKAWTENEPVVPSFTDLTIGILPLAPIGKPVSESLVHRLPLFTQLTGAEAGEATKAEHLARLITGRKSESGGAFFPGLFAKASGKKLLFLNQAEDGTSQKNARELLEILPQDFRKSMIAIIAGSVREDRVVEL